MTAGVDGPRRIVYRPARRGWGVRLFLLGLLAGTIALFAVARSLDPYYADGTARRGETHRQLGFPPCGVLERYGKPCPACGCTTSFALLMRGDLVNSLRANFAGTVMALSLLGLMPWLLLAGLTGRTWGVRSIERSALFLTGAWLALMSGRWIWVMLTG